MNAHTFADSGLPPSALQWGLDPYDRDTITYLAAFGIGDPLLERVRRLMVATDRCQYETDCRRSGDTLPTGARRPL